MELATQKTGGPTKFVRGARVLSNSGVAPRVFRMDLDAPEIAAAALPGQFVNVGLGRYDPLLPRPFSVHATPAAGGRLALSILYRVAGRGTAALSLLAAGSCVDVFGPLGNSFPMDRFDGVTFLVAGGMGAAPLRFACEKGAELGAFRAGGAELLAGAKTAADLKILDGIASHGVATLFATEDGSAGVRGTVTALLQSRLDAAGGPARVFAVGPEAMYRALAAVTSKRGVRCLVSLERRMACGVGVCRGCVASKRGGASAGYATVCADGPVFDIGEVELE